MAVDQQFCLRWNNHQSTLISVFDTLLENETLVDCTLAAEGKFLKAHKVVLSACSPYFATLLKQQYDKHPIFILKDVKYQELRAMMDYMYRGEVNISQDQLTALLKAAESLQIKGLSDNRSAGGLTTAPKPEHHGAAMPTSKLSAGYTLEQTKRARIIGGTTEPEIGSREGSSSPSRRRRKVRRRSIENAMTDVHDNSNSSQQLTQSNASGLGAITAAASALAAAAAAASAPNTVAGLIPNAPLSALTSSATSAVTAPGTTLSSSKKTDIVKGTTQQQHHHHQQAQQQDAMNTENVLVGGGPASATTATGSLDTETTDATTIAADKSNHKQLKQSKETGTGAASASELVIEPKAEYDDEANDEPVEDLTLDEEDMGMDDLDQNAGTSQGGEGSSQGYAPWQHDRSQDDLLLATQEAQQRDPQDLSITRIAGLTWNEWNARLAMPLVTQLREGVHPLVFPTDLSIEKGNAGSDNSKDTCKIERKSSPLKRPVLLDSPTPSNNDLSEQVTTSTPLNCSSASEKDKSQTASVGNSTAASVTGSGGGGGEGGGSSGGIKIKHFTEEEATVLMLKAAAEKSAHAANNSGNLSDNSYTDDNTSGNGATAGTGGSGGVNASDYHPAFADVGSATGISLNILNSINAMSNLISGGTAGGNGGLSLAGASALGGGGSGSGAGHPCPECGRVYKLKSSLRNHQKWECGKEPQFQCPFCVYRAKQKMHIGRHMERMHKEKFFKIEDLKSFTTATVGAQLAGSSASGGGGGSSVTGDESSSTAIAELRQHFS